MQKLINTALEHLARWGLCSFGVILIFGPWFTAMGQSPRDNERRIERIEQDLRDISGDHTKIAVLESNLSNLQKSFDDLAGWTRANVAGTGTMLVGLGVLAKRRREGSVTLK